VSTEINNDNEEAELENLISQFQDLKNPKNPEYLYISIQEFIKLIITMQQVIEEMQENESEEESKKQTPITLTQAITEINSVLGYIEQLELNFKIDIKVFAELKQMQKELAYLTKKI
ncbi:348_t:CDS:2, partial [Cetraspora pellucida]